MSFEMTLGRVVAALAFLALLGAWVTEVTGGPVLGMSQTHLFADAAVLFLAAVFLRIDATLPRPMPS